MAVDGQRLPCQLGIYLTRPRFDLRLLHAVWCIGSLFRRRDLCQAGTTDQPAEICVAFLGFGQQCQMLAVFQRQLGPEDGV